MHYHQILSHAKWLYSPALAPETEEFPKTRADDESRDTGESSAELGIPKFADGKPVKLMVQISCVILLRWDLNTL